MTRRFVALTALMLALAVPLHAAEKRWYVVEIMGSPVGFASEQEDSEGQTVVLRSQMDMKMTRMGTPLAMFMSTEEVCGADGTFQSARMKMTASITGMSASAELDGDSLTYRFETAGNESTRRIAWQEGAVSQKRANDLTDAWLRSDEPELSFTTFRVDEGKFVSMRVVRKGTETQTVGGAEQRVITTEEYEGDATSPTTTTTYDESLQPLRSVMRQMGLEIVIRRVSPEEMASIEVDPNFDIIRQSMIPCDGYPDPPTGVSSVTIRLSFPRPVESIEPLDGPNQAELGRGERWIDIRVSRAHVDMPAGDDTARYLEPDRFIQSDDPAIHALADSIRTAAGGGDAQTARAMAAWVNGYITGKNYAQGFASALEVLHTRTGDCTEHSVLLTSLLRAAGIPARPAVGLAYSEGDLVGHMWAEAVVDGQWTTFDALDLDTAPVRIRVSAPPGPSVDQRALMDAYGIVGGMTARVTDFTREE